MRRRIQGELRRLSSSKKIIRKSLLTFFVVQRASFKLRIRLQNSFFLDCQVNSNKSAVIKWYPAPLSKGFNRERSACPLAQFCDCPRNCKRFDSLYMPLSNSLRRRRLTNAASQETCHWDKNSSGRGVSVHQNRLRSFWFAHSLLTKRPNYELRRDRAGRGLFFKCFSRKTERPQAEFLHHRI